MEGSDVEKILEFLRSRDIIIRGNTNMELFADALANLASLASGGGVCLNCECGDCFRKLDDELAHELGRKNGLSAMEEACARS